MAWPDGRGFSVWSRGTSVNLEEERTFVLGSVTPTGQHIALEGPPEATTVNVYDNGGDPSRPIATWEADLSTRWDWLGAQDDAVFEGFGFGNGLCGVARWGEFWDFDGDPIPFDVGDVGWSTADTVLYLGPCDRPMERITAELNTSLAVLPVPGPVLKLDIPVFTLQSGVRTEAGPSSLYDPAGGYDVGTHGWGVDGDGTVVPLFEDVDAWLGRRRGTTFWTRKGRVLYRVDAAGRLD